MNAFIGKSLNLVEEYCNKNQIKYTVFKNSFSDEQSKSVDYFVTNILHRKEVIEIIVSKFKIEV